MENIHLSCHRDCLFPPIFQVVKSNVQILTCFEKKPGSLLDIAYDLVAFRPDRLDCSGQPIETVRKD